MLTARALMREHERAPDPARPHALSGDPEGHQLNLLASSKLSAERLIAIMRGRWCQENGFKHGNERWGINHLEARKVVPVDPDEIMPNPARRRLDIARRAANVREGDARNKLVRFDEDSPRYAAALRAVADAMLAEARRTTQAAPRHHPSPAPTRRATLLRCSRRRWRGLARPRSCCRTSSARRPRSGLAPPSSPLTSPRPPPRSSMTSQPSISSFQATRAAASSDSDRNFDEPSDGNSGAREPAPSDEAIKSVEMRGPEEGSGPPPDAWEQR